MRKLLNLILVITSLIGYLEWGNRHAFLFQVEYDLIFGNTGTDAFLHPFVLVPLCGQLMLLFTLFQKAPGRFLTLSGLACMSVIMVFLFLIGLIGLNIRIAASAIPFIITGVLVLRHNRRKKA